jgi:ferredoxin, 2Fe-2S
MGRITVIMPSGERSEVDAVVGESIMRLALNGGSPEWADRLPPPSEEEQVMVECAIEVRDTSRLSCQLTYTDALDGIEIEIPASQY